MNSQPLTARALQKFVTDLFQACGVDKDQCTCVAQNMVWSELVGRNNFGVLRIPIHIKRLREGVLNSNCRPQFDMLSASSARLDADNGFGHFAGEIAMRKAVELAKTTGIGMIGVNNSNFFGTGAYFANIAADQGMVSLVMSNSFPKVVAHGGRTPVLGTNPFAFGAPRKNRKNLLVDFATSSLAGSTVREYLRNGEQLPVGLAVLPNGEPLTNPAQVGEGSLMPFGGAKGYGIALMVEILSGILSGSGFSHSVKSTYSNFTENSSSGHCLIAIDIGKWMGLEEFYQRFEMLIGLIKASNPADEVLLPGEIRWRNYKKNINAGISIPTELMNTLSELSRTYNIVPPWETLKSEMLIDETG